MSGHPGRSALPAGWGGASQLPDGERWRALGVEASTDIATMVATCLRLRPEFAALDLPTSLRTLAAIADGSHALARLVQADQEAVRLLTAAGAAVPDDVLAFFPPEPDAVRATPAEDGGWLLDGRQQRSVHPQAVGSAVVVATTADGARPFLVRLDAPGVVADPTPLRVIAPLDPNQPVCFQSVPARAVADAVWWADRHPTAEAVLTDAAVWFGACLWLCRAVEASFGTRTHPVDRMRVGRVDVWVQAGRLALRAAMPDVMADPTGPAAELAARRAVATVATTVDTVIRLVALLSDARVGGEDPLLPSRVAQLQIALRRFDVEANLRAIGALVSAGVRSDPLGV